MTVLITGAGGTFGKILIAKLNEIGTEAKALDRSLGYQDDLENHIEKGFRTNPLSFVAVFAGIPAQPRTKHHWKIHRRDCQELFRVCRKEKIPFYYVSSLSVHEGNRSWYATWKRQIEKDAIESGGLIARFGIIQSSDPKSSYRKLLRILPALEKLGLLRRESEYYLTNALNIEMFARDISSSRTLNRPKITNYCEAVSYEYSELLNGNRQKTEVTRDSNISFLLQKKSISIHVGGSKRSNWLNGNFTFSLIDPFVNFYHGMKLSNDNDLSVDG